MTTTETTSRKVYKLDADPDNLTAAQVAAITRMGRATIGKAARAGALETARTVGAQKHRRFTRAAVDAWAAAGYPTSI